MHSTPSTVDWKPSPSEVAVWSAVGVGLFVVGVPLFALPWLIVHRSGSIHVGVIDVMTVLVLTLLLALLHEIVHAAAMTIFGARPTMGVTLVARVMPAMFTTSPGHKFTRLQYVAVAAAPALVVSALGSWATLTDSGIYLIIPLAAHLGGCVGDGAAIWLVMRQPRSVLCEDLREGVRFHISRAAPHDGDPVYR